MEFVIVLAILTLVVLIVSAPLRRPASEAAGQPSQEGEELAELEAARDAKYREIRDADLDHRTGKLSDPDYAELERELRAEAIEIMRELDRAEQLPSHEA
jgi:hypothetical protein